MSNKKEGNLAYSAGIVSKGFWFQAFKKYNYLIKEGYEDLEIKKMQAEENILLAPSDSYGQKMINEISKRSRAIPKEISEIFENLPISDQKIINLLGVMMTDRLFSEYMNEVYREKLIMGNSEFDNSDTRIFLKNKSEQSEKVANITSGTKKRLAGAYRTYLKESNLLEEKNNSTLIKKPLLDIQLEDRMKKQGLNPYLKIFLGE